MSRIPPQIEQKIEGNKIKGWQVLPISANNVLYKIRIDRPSNEFDKYLGQEMYLEAFTGAGELIWSTLFYKKYFDLKEEIDVQEIYPVDLLFSESGDEVIVKLEHYSPTERVYRFLTADGSIVEG